MKETDIVQVEFASANDVQAIAAVLGEAASWMAHKRSSAWNPADIGTRFVAPLVARSEFVVAKLDREIAGVCTLTRVDVEFWPEDAPGEAAYVHKLAVRRAFAGGRITPALIEWNCASARDWGCQALKLDCDQALRPVYQRLGFSLVDQRRIEPQNRPAFTVDRFRRQIASSQGTPQQR